MASRPPRSLDDRREPGSFRDPSGFIFERGGVLFRQVNRAYKADYDRLVSSGLDRSLIDDGWVIPYREVDEEPSDPDRAYKVIQPERVPFISYPYEWCFGQLKSAAMLTLALQRRALAHGMSLKDASAFNVQFLGGLDRSSSIPSRSRPIARGHPGWRIASSAAISWRPSR